MIRAVGQRRVGLSATVKQHYVRVRPRRVTGRRFVFGAEPDRQPPIT